ncbi:glutathione peroxidase [bacterium]|nr:glutathione peroxidase [bacterium]
MPVRKIVLLILFLFSYGELSAEESAPLLSRFTDYTVENMKGDSIPLSTYRRKVILAVNTATQCGFTPQFSDLEELYQNYKERGFLVLGFPSNDFDNQEPLEGVKLVDYCRKNFGVTFPLFKKGSVRGEEIQPVYSFLTRRGKKELQGPVEWNFEKFLISREGKIVARYGSFTNPLSGKVRKAVEKLLEE